MSRSIQDVLKERILILDGAMGTMIQQYTLEEEDFRSIRFKNHSIDLKGNNDLLSITQPKIIGDIHDAYLEAGADIIETNTFNSNAVAQADYDLVPLVTELNHAAGNLARERADAFTKRNPDKPRFVAGSLGPTNRTASLSPDVERPGFRAIGFKELEEVYYEQSKALIEAEVDLLLVETVFDTLNAKAAVSAIKKLERELGRSISMMISGTITDASGRTLSGQTAEAFLVSLEHASPLSIGLNCALGADQLLPYIEVLSKKADFAISAHPNAGLPNAFGEYDQGPEEMAERCRPYLERGLLNILGGCCGTGPEHIRTLADLSKDYAPRIIKESVL